MEKEGLYLCSDCVSFGKEQPDKDFSPTGLYCKQSEESLRVAELSCKHFAPRAKAND